MLESPGLTPNVAGVIQLGVAVVNLGLVRTLDWKEGLQRLPLLTREVFSANSSFLSLTLAIFRSPLVPFWVGYGSGRNPRVDLNLDCPRCLLATRRLVQIGC